MDAIGTGMIAAVIMLMPVNPYWGPKIERTKQRDQEHIQALETDGWKVIVLWECEIRSHFESTMLRLEHCLSQ